MLKASFGYFDKDGKEFVVTDYETPLQLVNYYWNERFISGASQHMAAIGCFTERPIQYMDPECRCEIAREENRHFYIRDDEKTFYFWRQLFDYGVFANAVISPAVAPDQALIRTSFMSTHTDEHLSKVLEILEKVAKQMEII